MLLQCHGNRWRHAGLSGWGHCWFTRLHCKTDWQESSTGLLWQQTDHMQRGAVGCNSITVAELSVSPEEQEIRLTLMRTWPWADGQYRFHFWGIWGKTEIDVLSSVSMCMCVCSFSFLIGPTKLRGKKWHNMPAINQTKLSTCGLTLSSQLLKYVVSNYWNMYATSVPRNTFSPAFSHSGSNQEHYSASRFKGLTVQSHQTVRGIGTMSGDQRHLSLALISPPSAWKWWKYEIWICLGCESSTGALFVCWAGPSDWSLAPPWKTLNGRAATWKQICWIIGSRLKTAAAPLFKRVMRM